MDLYDRCAAPATQAAYWNEGKIHLGLVYANDPTGQTHGRMLEGAMRFEALLTRWLQGPIVAITGTKGKSTTTTLVGRMLEASGRRVMVGGNIVGGETPVAVSVLAMPSP